MTVYYCLLELLYSRINSVCFIKSLFYCLSALKQCCVKLCTVGKKRGKDDLTNDAFETFFVNQSGLNRIYYVTQNSKNLLLCSMGEKMQNRVEMTWKWLIKIFFFLHHSFSMSLGDSYLIISVVGNPVESLWEWTEHKSQLMFGV